MAWHPPGPISGYSSNGQARDGDRRRHQPLCKRQDRRKLDKHGHSRSAATAWRCPRAWTDQLVTSLTMPYRILCNGTSQNSPEARSGLSLTPSRCTSLPNVQYGIEVISKRLSSAYYAFLTVSPIFSYATKTVVSRPLA